MATADLLERVGGQVPQDIRRLTSGPTGLSFVDNIDYR
jgi:hypothetical protein